MKNGRGGEKRGEAKKAFAAQENSQANQYGDIASTKGTIMKNAKLMKKVANFACRMGERLRIRASDPGQGHDLTVGTIEPRQRRKFCRARRAG